MKFGVGLQIYTVRDFAQSDLRGTLKEIRAMGYQGVEFAGLYGHAPEEVRSILGECGLIPVSAHLTLEEMLPDPDGILGQYAQIGCRYAAVCYLPPERRLDTQAADETLAAIRTAATAAKRLGMLMLYHNHDFEFARINGKYALDILYDAIPANLLATELDTCWVKVGGEDPAAYIRKYAGRAPIVHLKDFFMKKHDEGVQFYDVIGFQRAGKKCGEGDFEFRPVGYGMQDFPAILKASEEAGSGWVIVEQDSPSMGKNSLECAAMSLEYLKGLGV